MEDANAIRAQLELSGIIGRSEIVQWQVLRRSTAGWRGVGSVDGQALRVETLGPDATVRDLNTFLELQAVLARDELLGSASCFPILTTELVAAYRSLPGGMVLAQAMIPPGRLPAPRLDVPRLRLLTENLARYLVRLHDYPALDRSNVARIVPSLDLVRSLPWLYERERSLLCDCNLALQETLRRAADVINSSASVDAALLHGQFDPAHIVINRAPGESRFQVIGWWKIALGRREFDLGWFAGELDELANAWRGTAQEALVDLGVGFVELYRELAKRDLDPWLIRSVRAMKVLHHLWEFTHLMGGGSPQLVNNQIALAHRIALERQPQ